MPLQNMTAIQTVTVGTGGAANITFSSIPQTYTDLVIMISARSESAGGFSDELIKFNNTTTTYTNRYIYGNGSSALGGSNAYTGSGGFTGGMVGNTSTANTFGNKMIYIPNYTSSNKKSYTVDGVTENNATLAYMHLLAGLWDNTSAITSIVLVTDNGTDYAQYTTATLYGVSNTLAGGAKAYGGYVSEDTSYFYHTFTSSGTFTPTQSITADILVVAGGGGGGWGGGAGGGAGGLLGFNSQALTAQNYTITVGGGGAAGVEVSYPNTGSCGSKGGNSVFGALTTVQGGGGGHGTTYETTTTAVNGGSGGGQTGRSVASQNIGTGTSGQGNNGGAGLRPNPNVNEPSGGGGGAGATGGNATSTDAGAGGNGSSAYSSWGLATGAGQNISGTVWFAGGGGGGNFGGYTTTAGIGGNGGGGSAATTGFAGTANTGGGGGGSMGGSASGGAGGSGIVIVRYAK